MKVIFRLSLVGCLVAAMLALFPAAAHAQWVYVNDNNGNFNANTATGFMNIPVNKLLPIGGSPWATGGTGLGNTLAVKNQELYTLGIPPGFACLFISDPAPSTGFPTGDIATFTVTTGNGALALTGRFVAPGGLSGNRGGIPLAAGGKVLYAAYTASNRIVVWRVSWTGNGCNLTYVTQKPAAGLHGGYVNGMREAPNFKTLVVAYGDGSIESYSTPGVALNAAPCPVPINSTGFTDGNNGEPAGVDIAKNSLYAVFGDTTVAGAANPTELETVPLPIVCNSITKDFGGPIVASATFLGNAADASNLWLSPNMNFIYVSNYISRAITTVDYNEGLNTMALAAGCTVGHTNPTGLRALTWTKNAGIQTSTTAGTGVRLYVAEYGAASSVALLKVDGVGCTQEYPLSPFVDPNSNSGTNTWAALSLNAWPPRTF
jgi:hypothetical protein